MEIGDKVRVKDWGWEYDAYLQFMEKYGTKKQNKKWKPLTLENYELLKGIMDVKTQNATYTITNIQQHECYGNDVAIIENDTHVFMVGVEGLEVVE